MGKRSAKTRGENESRSSKKQKLESPELESGKIGIIESVSLVNFMCHENLSFEFGPHINFIIGRNGSGKSAILTGIILALGGRSSVTGRYPNIKGFIKKGKHKAKIEVVLRNRGDHPYKPDLYGTKVTVVREITSDGVSSYKLKSEAGKVISTHKEELNNILSAMDIQIENPVSLLTQENSRSFLTSKKPDKLYQFYYQGCGLDTLEKSYNNTRMMQAEGVIELKKKKEMLPGQEKELKALKKLIDTSAQLHSIQQELMWAYAIKAEKMLHKEEQDFLKAQKDQEICKQKCDKCKTELDETTAALNESQKRKEDSEKIMSQELRPKLKLLSNKCSELSGELRILENKLSSAKEKKRATDEEIMRMQNSINENLKRSQNDQNEEKRLREIQIQKLRDECQKYAEHLERLEQKRQELMESRSNLDKETGSVQNDINSCSYSLEDYKNMLIEAQNALKNKFNVFGDQTQNVLNEIKNQARRFTQLPKGPIGIYIEVKDSKWCDAVEECIKAPVLKGYCCDNFKDSIVLAEILKRFYPQNRPTIFISKYVTRVHDVSQYRPQTNFPTVFEMLKISDPVIANVLIDNVSIEARVLIEDIKTAVDAMMKTPKYCYGAILMDCSTIALNPYRLYSSMKQSRNSLLSSNGKGKIESLKKFLTNTQSSLNTLKSQKATLIAQANEITQQLADIDKEIIKMKRNMKSSAAEVLDLQNFQDPKDTQCIEEDLEQLESECEKIRMEVLKYEESVKEQSEIRSRTLDEINKYKKLLEREGIRFAEICSDLNSCVQKKETLASTINKYTVEFKNASDRLNLLQKEVERNRKCVEETIRNAEEKCPRIETDRSCEVLKSLLEHTKKVVEQQSNYNREELIRKYEEMLETLKQDKKWVAVKEKQVENLNKMYKKRMDDFSLKCNLTAIIIQLGYVQHLSKYYTGKLVFDSEARTLTLEAMPNKTGSEQKKRGGKCSSLSGGERSFVTVAFLLAMWERIRSPFKILDEYDVFMDSNNRNLCIGLLTEEAEALKDTQFIYLSPLDLPEIKDSPYIKIHQMQEPKRDENASL